MIVQFYLDYVLVVFLHGFRLWTVYYPWDHLFGPYITILNAADTLLLAFLPAAQLYKHAICKDRPLSVSDSDTATRVLKAKIWINTICMSAFWVHCVFILSKLSNSMKNLTAQQLALVVFSLPGLVFFSVIASTWTYLILMWGLSQPSQGPTAAGEQQCNGYIDFWRDNRTCIGWLACSFLIPPQATLVECSPSASKPDSQAVLDSKVLPDTKE